MGSNETTHGGGQAAADDVVRAALAGGDLSRALSMTLAAYGAEVYGFLRAVTPRGQDARLTYGRLIEVLQRDLQSFCWECGLRVLVYTVARRESRRDRELRAVSATALRTIADRLPPEDLELLVLRLDRAFSWRDLAHTSLGSSVAEELLLAEAERLHARFVELRLALSHLLKPETS